MNAPRPPSRWGKVLLLAMLIGVLTLAGAGVGGFLITNSAGARTGPGECGGSGSGCIPTLPYESVEAVLTEQGFACQDEANPYSDALATLDCELMLAYVELDVSLSLNSGHIQGYYGTLTITHNDLSVGSPIDEAFLTWLAALPFGADAEAKQAAENWIAKNLSEPQERAEVTIRGYTYVLEHHSMGMRLYVNGRG